MATGDELQNKRRKDRLTASMALAAAHRRGATTPCLSPEELAELVDGTVSATGRQAANTHLADCEHCYDAWLTVSEAMNHSRGSEREGRKIISLFSPKNFRWWGSALAVAASVVVFLNIQDSAIRETMDDLASTPEITQEKAIYSPTEISKMEELEEEELYLAPSLSVEQAPGMTEPARKRMAGKLLKEKSVHRQEIVTESDKEDGTPPLSASSPMLKSAPEPLLGGVEGKQQTKGPADEVELPSADSWLQRVTENCRAGTTDPAFWGKLRRQGAEIADKEVPESVLGAGQRERLTKVLELLQAVESAERIQEQCGRVLALLAEEDESR